MSDSPTPDAIALAFLEARENDKEPDVYRQPVYDIEGVYTGGTKSFYRCCHNPGGMGHTTDCPWRLRMEKLDKCEQTLKDFADRVLYVTEGFTVVHVTRLGEQCACLDCVRKTARALAALKGAPK